MERSEMRAGGSAGNAALAVSYLGGHSRLLSVVGNDDLGSWLRDQLRGLGACLDICDAPTTLSVGLIHSWGERTFLTTRGHLEKLSYEHIRNRLQPAPQEGSIVLLSGVFLTPQLRARYHQLIDDLNALGYQVALDTNWPPQDWSPALRAEVGGWICKCRHVLLNELEVSSLGESSDLDVALGRLVPLLQPGATLVVKVGSKGAIGIQGGRRIECSAPAISIFDTIGAGDSFNAGYLLARMAGANLSDALQAGCDSASNIIAHFPRRSIGRGELAGYTRAPRPAVLEET
jgi:sugar/nucleoside kinase (ribokinase family)